MQSLVVKNVSASIIQSYIFRDVKVFKICGVKKDAVMVRSPHYNNTSVFEYRNLSNSGTVVIPVWGLQC